jgi:hypothetical protein
MVEQYVAERASKLTLIENLKMAALDAGRDPNADDEIAIESAKKRVSDIDRYLSLVGDNLAMDEDTANRLSRVSASVQPAAHYRSAGQLLYDVLHQNEPDAASRYRGALRRATEHMGTLAADTTAVAGDLAGLVVKPNVGAVINPYPSGMPLASAIGLQSVPPSDGFGFSRPQVVDTGFVTGVGTQTAEKAELASKAFSITTTPVTLDTVGGHLNISQQLLSFNPASLGIILAQMRQRLENAVEAYVYAEFIESTGSVSLESTATAAQVLQSIYTAAANYYGITSQMPDFVAVGPLGWARLGGLADAAGRPMFPTLGAANAPGTANAASMAGSVAGLSLVVTPKITDTAMYVGGSEGIEAYLFALPVLESVEASVLGRQVAVAAAIAAYRPTPFANATQKISDTTP